MRQFARLLQKAYSPPSRAFMEIQIGGGAPTRVEFELFAKKCPLAVENFAKLCTGESVLPETAAKDNIEDANFKDQFQPQLTYKDSTFHRIAKGLFVQGGDLVSNKGLDQLSVYGSTFDAPDEVLSSSFSKKGLVGTAVSAPHLNGSQFFVVTCEKGLPHLDGTCICFGRVTKGMEVFHAIEKLRVDHKGCPQVECKVVNAGVQ